MAENKNSFLLYTDHKELWLKLSDEQAGKIMKMIIRYVTDENPEAPDELTDLLFLQFKQHLKRDLKKWEKYQQKQSENGKKGGRPKKPTETQKTQPFLSKPKKADNVNVNDNVNVSGNVKDIDDGVLYNIDTLFDLYFANPKLVKAVLDNNNFSDQKHLKSGLEAFNKHLASVGQFAKTWKDYTSHFLNWHKKNKNGKTVSQKSPTDVTL